MYKNNFSFCIYKSELSMSKWILSAILESTRIHFTAIISFCIYCLHINNPFLTEVLASLQIKIYFQHFILFLCVQTHPYLGNLDLHSPPLWWWWWMCQIVPYGKDSTVRWRWWRNAAGWECSHSHLITKWRTSL